MAPYLSLVRLAALATVVPGAMKLATFLQALLPAATMAQNTSFRIMSWNLRYDSQPDNITVQQTLDSLPDPIATPNFLNYTGEQPWSTRRVKVYDRVVGEEIQILGFQEALVRQVNDMAELLGDEWDWVGVGRDDGVAAGEFSPIYWKKDIFQLKDWDTFWLSNDPFDAGSKYPGAGSVRICTYAQFTVLATGQSFTYMNTHMDDQSDAQRVLGASLILWRAHSVASNGSTVVVTGDFNSPADGTDSGAYKVSTGAKAPAAINQTFADAFPIDKSALPEFTLVDMRTQLPRAKVGGNWATYTGFTAPNDSSQYMHIDFVFGGSNGGVTPSFYKVESQLTDDGILASDHRPVIADISF